MRVCQWDYCDEPESRRWNKHFGLRVCRRHHEMVKRQYERMETSTFFGYIRRWFGGNT